MHRLGVFSFARKLFSHIKQVSWLTDHRSASPSRVIRVRNGYHEAFLPVYSDRIAQVSHLIPSSEYSALDMAIMFYTFKI